MFPPLSRPAPTWRRWSAPLAAGALALAAAGLAPWSAPDRGRAAPAGPGQILPGDTYVLNATWPLPESPGEPVDVALGVGGDLYVADGRRNAVMAYDAAGRLRGTWTRTSEHELYVPVTVAADPQRDQVHIVWQRYRRGPAAPTAAGLFLDTRQADGTAIRPLQSLTFIQSATDMAVHAASGTLYVTADGRINPVRPGAIPGPAIEVGDTRGRAGQVAVTADGRLALVRPATASVALYTAEGVPVGTLDLAGHAPLAVAGDADGNVSVLVRGPAPEDPGAKLVMTFDLVGRLVGSRSVAALSAPPVPGGAWPWSLAAGPGGLALVTGAARFQVLAYDRDGAVRARLVGGVVRDAYVPRLGAETDRQGLALAMQPDGAVLAHDGRDASLVRFDAAGRASVVGGTPDDALDVALGPDGEVYATTEGGKVVRLDAGGLGPPAWEAACDCALGGRIAAGPGAVYVTRPRDQTVATFNPADGLRLRAYRLAGSVGLWPSDVTVAGDGRLFSGDLVAAQVQGWLRADAPDVVWQAGLLSGPRRMTAGRFGVVPVIAAVMADGFVEIHTAADGNLVARWRPVLSDGAAFEMTDIALGGGGEVYLADAGARAVRVFAPGASVPPTPPPEPSPSPTPSSLSCVVRGDKRAGPAALVLGETAAVTLTLAARCPSSTRVIGADIVLVMDRSGSMTGPKLAAARGAARAFAELLDIRHHRLGLVSFSDDATVDVPLTDSVADVIDGLERLVPEGETNMAAAVGAALQHLRDRGRAEALPVIVLLTDGQYTGAAADPRPIAADARAWGAQIYTIGLGSDVASDVLTAVAGDLSRYFFAPAPSELFPIYSQILRLVLASLAGNLVIDDVMGPDVAYVDGSANPGALVATGRLRWGRSLLPASGITLTYRVRPAVAGCLPTNEQALADYTDADGVRRQFVFPVPTVCVVTPSPTPTASPTPTVTPTPTATPTVVPRPIYLPLCAKCLSEAQHADVALVIDTSESMAGAKLEQARLAAVAFVNRLDLPDDQAAVVGFSTTARLAAELTGNRDTLEAAILGLDNSPGTRIDRALAAASRELLSRRRRPRNRPVVVLLSDGAHNGPAEDVLKVAAELRAFGVVTYAIGLGADVDRALLEAIAGPGRTYFVSDPGALETIYRDIAAAIPCR